MPFKSEAQRRKFHEMAARGEISQKTVDRWEADTPAGTLPERVKKAAYDPEKERQILASLDAMIAHQKALNAKDPTRIRAAKKQMSSAGVWYGPAKTAADFSAFSNELESIIKEGEGKTVIKRLTFFLRKLKGRSGKHADITDLAEGLEKMTRRRKLGLDIHTGGARRVAPVLPG